MDRRYFLIALFCFMGAYFQDVNAQSFSSLESCNCMNNVCTISSTIVPSASLPWSFNWVLFPSTTNVVIASVTVNTGGAATTITPSSFDLGVYTFQISNTPNSGVVSPNNFVSTITTPVVDGYCSNGGPVIGISGSASVTCLPSCDFPMDFNETVSRSLSSLYCGAQTPLQSSQLLCGELVTLSCPPGQASINSSCLESGSLSLSACAAVTPSFRPDQIAIVVLNVLLAVVLVIAFIWALMNRQ